MTPSAPLNIASYLPAMAEQQPEALAVAVQRAQSGGRYRYEELTAKELDDECNRVAHGLQRIGIGPGVRTVLMVRPSLEFFALTFALFKVGAVPVMVDPGMGTQNLSKCLARAEPEAFIGVPKAQAARVLAGWGRATIRICVTVGRRLFWGGHTLAGIRGADDPFPMAQTRAQDTAAILFTSGSTGTPKGAVYTHGVFDAQIRCLRDDYGIEPGERDLATFPLFALFGPALGMAAVVPDMDASRPIMVDPKNIIAAVKDYETTNFFASPALIGRVGEYGARHGIELPTLRRVISAGAPASESALTSFAGMLPPGVEIWPSYGATESLPISRIGSNELLHDTASRTREGAGMCVGRPIGDAEVKIIHVTDSPIAEWSDELEAATGEIGEICVRGPIATQAYYNDPSATALAKIRASDGGVIHRMGDVGYLDESGRLWFCGRKAHRVTTASETLYTLPCERVFDTHPLVRRTALVGVAKGDVTFPVLCVELNEDAKRADRERVIEELRDLGSRHVHTSGISIFLFHPEFPVDVRHNAKIFREKLAEWAKGRIA